MRHLLLVASDTVGGLTLTLTLTTRSDLPGVGGVRLGCCSRRVRVCASLSGVLFSVGVCVCVTC